MKTLNQPDQDREELWYEQVRVEMSRYDNSSSEELAFRSFRESSSCQRLRIQGFTDNVLDQADDHSAEFSH